MLMIYCGHYLIIFFHQVGFLNDAKPESKLDAFLSTFDVVLVNDTTMEVPTMILELICGL